MEKNNKTLNVPHLRFPEFSGEWEKTSIDDCCSDLEYGMNAASKNFDGVNKYIRITDIDELTAEYKQDSLVSPDALLEDKYLVKDGDILFARTGASTGKTYIYAPQDGKLYYAGFLIRANVNFGTNPKFVFYQTQTHRYKKWVSIMSMRSGQPGINSQEYASYQFWKPTKEEQDKISDLITLLDQRIKTQKKIIEDLKKLKDAICNLNFTSGSSLTLGDVGYFVRGLTYSASDVIDDTAGTAVMRSNNISNGDPVNFDELIWVNKAPNHDQILRAGDMVICMANGSSALVGKSSYYINSEIELATVGAFCGIYRSDNPLTKWLFQSTHYKKHLQRSIQGGNGAIANIYPEDILAISFNIPADHERILNILNSLEEKHLLEHKLLCGYLGVKSHLLSQLFI